MDNPTLPKESVWDYPRPPRLVEDSRSVVVEHGDLIIADTKTAVRVLETSHPPVFYIDTADVDVSLMSPSTHTSWCEFKGRAIYWDLRSDPPVAHVAWSYPEPAPGFAQIANRFAFYPSKVTCHVAGERVHPQAGGFYGGWITSEVVGPFKGGPGTTGW